MVSRILHRCFAGLPAGILIASFLWSAPVLAVDLDLHAGYRTDDFDWNIASDFSGSSTPNILSELTWENLEIYQLGLKADSRINGPVPFLGLITGSVNYGSIFSGSNQDSDYHGNNRTIEFSRSNNDADDGDVWDLSVAVGPPEFLFFSDKLALSPLFGYSYHEQNLTLKNGFQTIPVAGYIPGLASSYDAVWKGTWLGINFRFASVESFNLFSRFEWHIAEYQADANWNLRDDLQHPVSFAQYANDAEGLVASLGAELAVNAKVGLTLEATYMNWQADGGTDTVFIADGTAATVRLNEVNWKSAGMVVGFKMKF